VRLIFRATGSSARCDCSSKTSINKGSDRSSVFTAMGPVQWAAFSRGALYALLSNRSTSADRAQGRPLSRQHEAILDRPTWDSVQDQLRDGAPEQRDGQLALAAH